MVGGNLLPDSLEFFFDVLPGNPVEQQPCRWEVNQSPGRFAQSHLAQALTQLEKLPSFRVSPIYRGKSVALSKPIAFRPAAFVHDHRSNRPDPGHTQSQSAQQSLRTFLHRHPISFSPGSFDNNLTSTSNACSVKAGRRVSESLGRADRAFNSIRCKNLSLLAERIQTNIYRRQAAQGPVGVYLRNWDHSAGN